MRKLIVGIGAILVSTTMMSHAQSPGAVALADNETSQLWFVELSSAPGIEGTAAAVLDREEASFHQAASGAGIRYSENRHYRDLFNGLTVRATSAAVTKLRALPGVQAVYPVVKISLAQEPVDGAGQLDVDTEQAPPIETDLITAVKQTGADIAQSELGLTGRGVKVAVIDTGIDYNHPDLGGCFGPGCRVAKGYDLVGDDFNSQDLDPIIAPDPDPDDCAGHGTHVAGIIGANGGITGVAPGVTFFAYRVFGCDGTTTADIMLDAMERARRDGADVVNMSIGAAFQWPQYPTAKAADRLVHHGIVVVASAGNEGDLGLYGSAAPSVGKDVIAVASFENTHANLTAFTISPDDTAIGYLETDSPPPPLTGSFPMARTGTATSTSDACAALPVGSLTGKVALIRRGTCGFYVKAFNAQAAGAVGVVIYNSVSGFIGATVAGTPPITIPVVTITSARGVLINNRLASGPVTMTWTSQAASEPNPTANLISSFSSYGPAPDLSFKPDLGAPGGFVRSTLPLEQGGYGNLSGTSMSSPHVAGAAALMLEARPHADPREVQIRMQNTARPQLWSGNPTIGLLDIVHRQGAGMLRIDDAITSDVTVSPSSLALGEFETNAAVQRTLRLEIEKQRHHRHKHGDEDCDQDDAPAVTYTLSHVSAVVTGPNTFTPSFFDAPATVTFGAPTVTLGGNDEHGHGHGRDDDAKIDVTIAPNAALPNRSVFGGYIVLTPDDDSPILRVPYTGFKGDYQSIQVVTPTPAGFPWLASLDSNGGLHNQPNGATFTMQGNDVPFILLHLDHQSRNLKLEAIEVATGKSFNFADDEDYLGRNSRATSFFAFSWDGTTFRRQGGKLRAVPNGTYRLELSVLKALGDPNNPAHTEHWSSPNITIARPATP